MSFGIHHKDICDLTHCLIFWTLPLLDQQIHNGIMSIAIGSGRASPYRRTQRCLQGKYYPPPYRPSVKLKARYQLIVCRWLVAGSLGSGVQSEKRGPPQFSMLNVSLARFVFSTEMLLVWSVVPHFTLIRPNRHNKVDSCWLVSLSSRRGKFRIALCVPGSFGAVGSPWFSESNYNYSPKASRNWRSDS